MLLSNLSQPVGDYDKTGLPEPFELRFYLTLAQLAVIPAKRH